MIQKFIIFCAVMACTMATMPLSQSPPDNDKRSMHFLAKSIIEKKMEQNDYRLPRNTAPLVYIIELDPDFFGEVLTFNGNGTIIFQILRPTTTVIVHRSDKMDIQKHSTELIDINGIVRKPITQKWNPTNGFFSIKFSSKLKIGNYSLKMSWTGADSVDDWYSPNTGFFRAYDKDENGKPKYLVTTHFEPIGARRVFPCWDEPGMKAQFEISIKHYPNYTALSNMPVKIREELPNGKILTKFERSPRMSPYLPCLAVADYKHIANKHGNITFYALESALDSLKYALEVSEKVIPAMEFYTGIPYALPKLDQITIPQYSATAMEHWGLVSYVTPSVLTHNATLLPNTYERTEIALLVAHELSHQWFGNLVTPVWWDDAWLNEAFAAYFQYKVFDMIFPEQYIMDNFVVRHVNDVSFRAENYIAKPIKWNPTTKSQISDMFSPVTYAKGAGVLHMLDHILGEETFRDGIRRYLKAHQFTAVVTDDLWDDLQAAYDERNKDKPLNIKKTMEPWIEQTGHPIVTVTRNYETGEVILTQNNAKSTNPDNKWKIPINYATKSNPDFSSTLPTMWLNKNDDNVTISNIPKDDWIILNIQQRGFYLVNYDEQNWRLIADYLNSDNFKNIPPVNRAQLVSDVFRMFHNAKVDKVKQLEILINITSYYHRETDYYPWVSGINIMEKFHDMMRNTPDEEILNKYMLFLMDKSLSNTIDDNDELKTKLKLLLWPIACILKHPGCRNFTENLFNKFLENPTYKVFSHHNNRLIVCFGLREANETVWKSIMNNDDLKNAAYKFLPCSKSKEIRKKYMDQLFLTNGTDLPIYQILQIFRNFLKGDREVMDDTLNYFIDHFELIENNLLENYDSDDIIVMLAILEVEIKNPNQYVKFKAFLESRLEMLKDKYEEPDISDILKELEDGFKLIEARSAIFHELMNKHSFTPNTIDNNENINKS